MQYKKSRYNVIVDHITDDKQLIYNTYSGILGIMDAKTQELYNSIENRDITANLDPDEKQNFETMIRYGYLVDSQLDELATFKLERLKERVRGHFLGLTIAPTMACNMRCPYCYENKTGQTMSSETQDSLVKFVEAHFSKNPELKRLSVTWYGGEPLLQKNTIYTLSKSFIELCDQYNVSYEASIITNGTLLDVETARKLRFDCNVLRTQITIDGMPTLHNKRRIFADGSGSFDTIVQNIERCLSFMNIVVRMNVDKTNENDVEEFLHFAVDKLGWTDNPQIYIAPVDNCTDSCAHSTIGCFARAEFANVKTRFQRLSYSIDHKRVRNEFFPGRNALNCSAESINNYVIDPDGDYYTCWMVIGDKQYKTGHIEKPFMYTDAYYKWLSNDLPSKCEACEYLPMCAGGCGYFRIIKESEPLCATTYYSYKETLRLAYRYYMEKKSAAATTEQ